MNKLVLLVFLTLSVCGEESLRPTKMTFSYVDHPTMVNYLVPLIESTYQKLDIKTHFIAQPSNRNLRLLEDNLIDGDVGYLLSEVTDYENIFFVEPPVTTAFYTLLCQPNSPCSESVLLDETQILVSTVASKNGFLNGYKGEVKNQFYTVNNLSLIPQFITEKRFDYAIYPTTSDELWRIQTADFQHVKLHQFNLYHVLIKKYQFMADEVSQALQEALKERTAKQHKNELQ
ncbi:hypothetical protein [Aliiglaciecola sp. LCG003]|uniref:hypothetical protein n=1 Tax=Aliiglaciecola sp. LCG003 TaxID=3053655 RepID=UPI0025742C8B|nr:hypothetical protein [Aliiglaciecola sp. LCG003]WJG09951.1 hypothetical protein QR722_02640 [Aliiglaciecola sp. LCG003]